MVYLWELSSSLGKCYCLFPNCYTGTEKAFTLTWQNFSRRRQWVLLSWLGTMSWAGINHFFFQAGGRKQEIIDDALLTMDTGYRASPATIKPLQRILLLTTAHWSFRRNKQTKHTLCTFASSRKLFPSHQLNQSKAWLHDEYRNDLKEQHWGKVEEKAPIS